MDSQKQQASERIKQANNILVTVSNNPSVDQLAACIGLTLALNKMGKHATAVFSGMVPSTLEFLQPEKTIEKTTDSLRDFIISLDKAKADKLRYKVEDTVVKIFITPYRTSITDKDLEFSQGDFNVDVVLALGVHSQGELDQAITSHGRILHDATIVTLNVVPGGELGSINWLDPNASSLSEIAVELLDLLDRNLMDGQIATAFLTGIVSETERFSNVKTTPHTMSVSAELMGSGANQQLVSTKLEEPAVMPLAPIARAEDGSVDTNPATIIPKKNDDGTLEIAHEKKQEDAEQLPEAPKFRLPEEESQVKDEQPPKETFGSDAEQKENVSSDRPVFDFKLPSEPEAVPAPQISIDAQGALVPASPSQEDILPPKKQDTPVISRHNEPLKMMVEPPSLGTPLNASDDTFSRSEQDQDQSAPGMPSEEAPKPPSMDTYTSSIGPTIMPPSDNEDGEDQNAPGTSFLGDQSVVAKEEPKIINPTPSKTLSDIEQDVHSTHLSQTPVATPFASGPTMPTPFTPPSFDNPLGPANDAMLPPLPSSMPSPVVQPPNSQLAANEELIPDMPVKSDAPAEPLAPTVDSARDAVMQAINGSDSPASEPVQALNAQPGEMLANSPQTNSTTPGPASVQPWTPPPAAAPELDAVQKAFMQPDAMLDAYSVPTNPGFSQQSPSIVTPTGDTVPFGDGSVPPPVPPPMMPPLPTPQK